MEKPHLPDGTEWPPETEEWFEAWRESPSTDSWDARQWQYMFDTAIVHALIYQSNQFNYLGELRARLSYMGLNFDPAPPEKQEAKITAFDVIKGKYEQGHSRREATS